MNLFYIKEITEDTIKLNEEESRHCSKVLRLRKGDHVFLLNGKGSMYEAVIEVPDAKACILGLIKEEKKVSNRGYQLTIAIAPTKNMDRFEWFAEKATEIGIDFIVPLICQHSERKDLKTDRLEKILVSAMKQSGQLYLPQIVKPTSFKDFVNQPFAGDKMIAHCEPGNKSEFKHSITPGKNVLILIGPEGDFSPAEISIAINNGFSPVSLGETRLRTETAGLVACHTVCLVNCN